MVFAKSTPVDNPETLLSHTTNVLQELELLRNSYGTKIIKRIPNQYKSYFWDALSLVCKAHDLGKVQSIFQNKLLRACKKLPLLRTVNGLIDIPHNFISPAFISNQAKTFPKEIRPAIYQAIAFHHGRGIDELLNDKAWISVEDVIKKDVIERMYELTDMQALFSSELSTPSSSYLRKLTVPLTNDVATFYLILKGCLHRADHSGSAHLNIEEKPYGFPIQQINDYLVIHQGIDKTRIWQYPLANSISDQNVVLQAGTGSGKTEFALYWAGQEKIFYTLPMRTSVNAMYERLKETFSSINIGLLHSDSAIYALSTAGYIYRNDNDNGLKETLLRIDTSRQLSMPLSVSTADQIFTSVFGYRGYEKIFATLAYSRLIVDEIQSYDPDMVAVILKTLVDINKIGCKFCVITATLPNKYLNYLKEKIPKRELAVPSPRFKSIPRHRIKLIRRPINSAQIIDLIIDLNKKYGGVLVIANTIKMAKTIKTLLSKREEAARLLHSMFIYEDRDFKERDENEGILRNQRGIWITTQIAEVSLDIDFNVMVTEISSIDSQIQRWGRVWRRRGEIEYVDIQPNIYITSFSSDRGSIYDSDLVDLTRDVLQDHNNSLLSDSDEYQLVQEIFRDASLKSSAYVQKFEKSLRMLEEYHLVVDTKREAQRLFRRISNTTVIPSEVYFSNQTDIDKAISKLGNPEVNRLARLRSLVTIRKKSVAVPTYYLDEIKYEYRSQNYGIIIADMQYSFETGVHLAAVHSAESI